MNFSNWLMVAAVFIGAAATFATAEPGVWVRPTGVNITILEGSSSTNCNATGSCSNLPYLSTANTFTQTQTAPKFSSTNAYNGIALGLPLVSTYVFALEALPTTGMYFDVLNAKTSFNGAGLQVWNWSILTTPAFEEGPVYYFDEKVTTKDGSTSLNNNGTLLLDQGIINQKGDIVRWDDTSYVLPHQTHCIPTSISRAFNTNYVNNYDTDIIVDITIYTSIGKLDSGSSAFATLYTNGTGHRYSASGYASLKIPIPDLEEIRWEEYRHLSGIVLRNDTYRLQTTISGSGGISLIEWCERETRERYP